MTSKEQYQKALNKLGVVLEKIINDYMLTSTEINKIKKQYKTIQKLIDQQSNPTLFDCIKEWEEKGFEDIENNNKSFSARNVKLNVDVYIDKRSKNIQISSCYYNYAQTITYELHSLIHKTLKALEGIE